MCDQIEGRGRRPRRAADCGVCSVTEAAGGSNRGVQVSDEIDKKALSERDVCTKYITPAITGVGWDLHAQIREEVSFTAGRIIVKGKKISRGKAKRADYVLYYKPGVPIAVIEAKDNNHSLGSGMQQAIDYGEILDVPFCLQF